MYKYIFGPVQSRRFGLSLGIDLSPDEKSCNFDCLYCELSKAKVTDTIKNSPKVSDVIDEVKKALQEYPLIDVITITANGEPTLYLELDTLVDQLNLIKGDKKLLILSNSSTISDENIRKTVSKIDIVKLSLDCVSTRCFRRIDRALSGIDVLHIIEGLKKFRKIFDKEMVIEILIVSGVNDNPKEMKLLNEVLGEIKPNRIDIGSVDRPPAYPVEAVDSDWIQSLSREFVDLPVCLIYKQEPKERLYFSKDEILQTIKRRPQSQDDIKYLFDEKSQENLKRLVEDGEVSVKNIAGVEFFTLP